MKFKIEEQKQETSLKCIRFPKELIKEINENKSKKITFSKFVIEACKYALDNLEK